MITQIVTICTDPLFGYGVMHSAAQPYAVAQVEILGLGAEHVVHIYSRHTTLKGARRAKAIRKSKARDEALGAAERAFQEYFWNLNAAGNGFPVDEQTARAMFARR